MSSNMPGPPGGDGVPFGGIEWDDQTGLQPPAIAEVRAHVEFEDNMEQSVSKPYAPHVSFPASDWPGVENVTSASITLLLGQPELSAASAQALPPMGEYIQTVAFMATLQEATIMNVVSGMSTAQPPP